MRPVLPSDLDLAARVLLLVPPGERVRVMDDLIAAAQLADVVGQLTGRPGAGGGNGSIMAAALEQPRAAATAANAAYRACLAVAIDRLDRAETITRCEADHHAYMAGERAASALG